ncbi:putative 6-phosphogluconolactonase [Astathelohania contejeani]|uniref:6-phosphogluconolactonase n=1 Tax=Astathelohania contejeani TaxID=164912 RepID=A0ABQ7HWA8_9MICR|nr:putative 6-phosphogluconolactonase [Thelohania contejeani]
MIHEPIFTDNFSQKILNILSNYSNKQLNLMISGGSILPFLEITKKLNTAKWKIYFCDERITSNKSDLNYQQASPFISHILNFPIYTDKLTPKECVENYKIPEIDLAFLGVGDDGHIASLEPMSPYLNSEEKLLYIENFPNSPNQRITVSIKFLNEVKKIYFLIPPKNGVLKKVKAPHPSILNKLTSDVFIILDQRCAYK